MHLPQTMSQLVAPSTRFLCRQRTKMATGSSEPPTDIAMPVMTWTPNCREFLVGTVGNRLLGVMILELLGSSTFLTHPVGCGITLAPKMLLSDAEVPAEKRCPPQGTLGWHFAAHQVYFWIFLHTLHRQRSFCHRKICIFKLHLYWNSYTLKTPRKNSKYNICLLKDWFIIISQNTKNSFHLGTLWSTRSGFSKKYGGIFYPLQKNAGTPLRPSEFPPFFPSEKGLLKGNPVRGRKTGPVLKTKVFAKFHPSHSILPDDRAPAAASAWPMHLQHP